MISTSLLRYDVETQSYAINVQYYLRYFCLHPSAELEYRLDYMLKVGKMENAYISALTSHTAYWTNQDVALFVLTQIFPHCEPV